MPVSVAGNAGNPFAGAILPVIFLSASSGIAVLAAANVWACMVRLIASALALPTSPETTESQPGVIGAAIFSINRCITELIIAVLIFIMIQTGKPATLRAPTAS